MHFQTHIPEFGLPPTVVRKFATAFSMLGLTLLIVAAPLHGETINGNVTVDYGSSISDYLGIIGQDSITIGGNAFDLTATEENNGSISFGAPSGSILNGGNASFNTLTISANLSAGSISADGNLSIGAALTLGTWNAGVDEEEQPIYLPGIALSTNITGTSPEVLWKWQQNGAVTPTSLMTLDTLGVLTLFAPANNHAIAIDPANATLTLTTNSSSATISLIPTYANYSSSQLYSLAGGGLVFATDAHSSAGPESIIIGDAIVGQTGNYSNPGDALFIGASQEITLDPGNQTISFAGGRTIAPGNIGTLFGTANITVGNYASANGTGAVAIMANSSAVGAGAVAVSNGSASGNFAIALGANSTVSADGAIALQGGNASASDSLAMGAGAIANGSLATALGTNVTAQTWGSVTLGRYNSAISGTASTFVATDPVLIVGMGQNSSVRTNALVILNNGNSTVNNYALLTNSAYVSATNATQPLELIVNQNSVLNGQTTLNGVVIISQSQGDVPMGEFGN